MYPRPFTYHRASSLEEAARMLEQLGEGAKLLAGGQSLIPLMKLRLASPPHLVDLNFIPELNFLSRGQDGEISIGPLARHAEVAASPISREVPILHDCAAGIADSQIRNWGTVAGSLAEADPTGDWAPVLLTLDTSLRTMETKGERSLPLSDFVRDAFTTALHPAEVVREIRIRSAGPGSGGAYVAFKRCAPVYATASVAAQVRIVDGKCARATIVLGSIELIPVIAREAADSLLGTALEAADIARAADAARSLANPQMDQRGSSEYKRALIAQLTREALEAALGRARGEKVDIRHHYA